MEGWVSTMGGNIEMQWYTLLLMIVYNSLFTEEGMLIVNAVISAGTVMTILNLKLQYDGVAHEPIYWGG